MRLKGWRSTVGSALVSAACAGPASAQQVGEPPAAGLPQPSAQPSGTTPVVPAGKMPETPMPDTPDRPAMPVGAAADVARQIAQGCLEKRYSDVGELLHPTLRRTWIEIDYKVKDFCELITRGYTLSSVRVESEERVGEHAVVFLTYVYAGGGELVDRSTFLPYKGAWRLTGS